MRLASHQMPTVRRRVRVGLGRVRPRRAMSSSCCEVMGKLPVFPLSEIRFRLVSRSLTAPHQTFRSREPCLLTVFGSELAGQPPHESFLSYSLPSICTCENR